MDLIELLTPPTLTEIKAKIAGYAALGGLLLDSWDTGDPGTQLYLAIADAIRLYVDGSTQAERGFVLDLATDPGDPDDYNAANALLEPSPGFLSAKGQNDFFTTRRGATKATGIVTITNTTGSPVALQPFQATFASNSDATKTYRNSADPTIYTPANTLTLAPSAVKDIPIESEGVGSFYSFSASEIVRVQLPLGVTVSNSAGGTGTDREDAPLYRARCRGQAAGVSPNGASDAYRRLSNTNFDGTPLLRGSDFGGDDLTPVGITRVYVSPPSPYGKVVVYYADPDGPADSVDVDTANNNIRLGVIASPGCVAFAGFAATATTITVTWAVAFKLKYQGKAVTGTQVKAAIVAALTARFKEYDIGGFDQVAGAGTIYREDVRATVEKAHPAIYNATISQPASDTSIALGHVPVLNNPTGTETGA